MSTKYSFSLSSEEARRKLPGKIIIGQGDTETIVHVGLKLIGFVYFHRERLQLETRVPSDAIQFVPDLVQLDYELRPKLWVECGECGLAKLNKLAVKAPEAEIWVVKRSMAAAEELVRGMAREGLRRNRYQVLGLEGETFDEMCGLIESRNDFAWFKAAEDPAEMHFDLNGLWFEMPYQVLRY